MKMPERVNTRKRAIIETLGFDPNEVPEGSFDEDGFEILGDKTDRGGYFRSINSGERLKTFIPWPNPDVAAEAMRARDGDFDEMFGEGATARLAELQAIVDATHQP